MKKTSHLTRGFDKPTDLPANETEREQWQEENRAWWEKHPMRYDWNKAVEFDEFSKEFFMEIDRRFFSNVKQFMPWSKTPFDPLIDFDSLAKKDVLEIGTGNGSHAQLLARHARSYVGIDITDYAVKSTSERMNRFGIDNVKIVRMDAENMEFDDESFDYIWTWGVVHHSSNTEAILEEMRRVLKGGGMAVTMVYHRGLWNYYISEGIFRGIIKGDLWRAGSLHKCVQKNTDGAIARFYSAREWRSLASKYFDVKKILVYGSKAEIIPLPGGKVKSAVLACVPNLLSRFLTNHCRFGSFLVSVLEKGRIDIQNRECSAKKLNRSKSEVELP